MREKKGHPLPLGVTENNGYVNFSVAVEGLVKSVNVSMDLLFCLIKLYPATTEPMIPAIYIMKIIATKWCGWL